MAYIPKNKIKTNLYTTGNEFIIESTGEEYIGYYYSLYTGEKYTGKTQNDPPNQLLVPFQSQPLSDKTVEYIDNFIPYSTTISNIDEGPFPNKSSNSFLDRATYYYINDQGADETYRLPRSYYSLPTVDDYNLGVFTRYFCVKINETHYIETNKEDYEEIFKSNPEYLFQMYTPFKLQWTLVGNERYVFNTNRNAVIIAEKRLKRIGLKEFLKGNYLKFYK